MSGTAAQGLRKQAPVPRVPHSRLLSLPVALCSVRALYVKLLLVYQYFAHVYLHDSMHVLACAHAQGMVLSFSMKKGRKQIIILGTKHLEQNPGDMLRNREAVWETAEEMAAAFRQQRAAKMQAGANKGQKEEAGDRQEDGGPAAAAVDLKASGG